MSQAAARAPQIAPQAPEPAPLPQQRKTSIAAWLRTWSEVLVAEVLNAMERRHGD